MPSASGLGSSDALASVGRVAGHLPGGTCSLSRRNSVRKAGSGRVVVVVTGSSHAGSVTGPFAQAPDPSACPAWRTDPSGFRDDTGRRSADLPDQLAGLGQQLAHPPPPRQRLGRAPAVLERVPVAPRRTGTSARPPPPALPPPRRRPARAPAPGPRPAARAQVHGPAPLHGIVRRFLVHPPPPG